MSLATCRRCQAVFIVDLDENGGTRALCPYCGREMEPAKPQDVQKRIERRRTPPRPEPPDAEAGPHVGTGRLPQPPDPPTAVFPYLVAVLRDRRGRETGR
ncbi:MAG: hypothetical protein ACK47B_09690 [Armatimonadota bacterium]